VKSVLLALLGTILGAAMIAGGIYGLVKGDDDEEKSASTPAPAPFVPAAPRISPSLSRCDAVAKRDPRLAKLDDLKLRRTGDETGEVESDLICNGTTVVLSVRMTGLKATETTKYYAWLSKDGDRVDQVGTLLGNDGRAFGSVTIGPEVDTTRYDDLLITRVPFGEDEKRPRTVVFRAPL
jgi:hypothetical protein